MGLFLSFYALKCQCFLKNGRWKITWLNEDCLALIYVLSKSLTDFGIKKHMFISNLLSHNWWLQVDSIALRRTMMSVKYTLIIPSALPYEPAKITESQTCMWSSHHLGEPPRVPESTRDLTVINSAVSSLGISGRPPLSVEELVIDQIGSVGRGRRKKRKQSLSCSSCAFCVRPVVPRLFDTKDLVSWKTAFLWTRGGWWGDGSRMIQVYHIYCSVYFSYYSRSTSGHQTLDPRCWGPLCDVIDFCPVYRSQCDLIHVWAV